MHDGRQYDRWCHTAALLAQLHNAFCVRGREKSAWEFHPYMPRAARVQPGTIHDLRVLLPK
jgi:hypothetical protein